MITIELTLHETETLQEAIARDIANKVLYKEEHKTEKGIGDLLEQEIDELSIIDDKIDEARIKE